MKYLWIALVALGCGGAELPPAAIVAGDPVPTEAVEPAPPEPVGLDVFAEFLVKASVAVVAAAQARPFESRWHGPDEYFDLRGTTDEDRRAVTADFAPLLTVLEGNMVLADAPEPRRLKFLLIMPADGRVLFAEVDPRSISGFMSSAAGASRRAQMAQEAPELQRLADYLRGRLAAPECELPRLTPDAIANLPEVLRAPLTPPPGIEIDFGPACEVVRSSEGDWQMEPPEDFVVIGTSGGEVIELVSDMEIGRDGDFFLERVRARPMR